VSVLSYSLNPLLFCNELAATSGSFSSNFTCVDAVLVRIVLDPAAFLSSLVGIAELHGFRQKSRDLGLPSFPSFEIKVDFK